MTSNPKSRSSQRSTADTKGQTPVSTYSMPSPTKENIEERNALIDELKIFLGTATDNWQYGTVMKRFKLATGETISCVHWDDMFFVTGTDIVRSLTFRFHAFGRPVTNLKKFEEGIFSDLRNLKPGTDARLEEPKSELLDMLYKNNCIRTQKKQKVFHWYSVPHDRLFLDALERDLKREKMGIEPTSVAVADPAASVSLDTSQELFDQLRKSMSMSAAAATAHLLNVDHPVDVLMVTNKNNDHANTPTTDCSLAPPDDPMPHSDVPLSNATPSGGSATPAAAMTGAVVAATTTGFHLQDTSSTPTSALIGSMAMDTWASPSLWSSSTTQPTPLAELNTRRARIHSVPCTVDPPSPNSSMMQSLRQRHRLSHPACFAPVTSHLARNRAASTASSMMSDDSMSMIDDSKSVGYSDVSKATSMSSELADSVSRLDIVDPSILPSKSLDSNTIKKTKAIIGGYSLFDGSPTYKQRRRRATSTSGLSQPYHSSPLPHGDSARRHTNCHLRTTSVTSPTLMSNMNSRLVMAAAAAGFASSHHQHQSHRSSVHGFPPSATRPDALSHRGALHTSSSTATSAVWSAGDQDGVAMDTSCHPADQPLMYPLMCVLCNERFLDTSALFAHQKIHGMMRVHASTSDTGGKHDDDSEDHSDPSSEAARQHPPLPSSTHTSGPQQHQQGYRHNHQYQNHHHQHSTGLSPHSFRQDRLDDTDIDMDQSDPVTSVCAYTASQSPELSANGDTTNQGWIFQGVGVENGTSRRSTLSSTNSLDIDVSHLSSTFNDFTCDGTNMFTSRPLLMSTNQDMVWDMPNSGYPASTSSSSSLYPPRVDDDFSSSASSPSSILQQQQQQQQQSGEEPWFMNPASSRQPFTLLSEFKPAVLDYSPPLTADDACMLSNPDTSFFQPLFTTYQDAVYAPFVAPADVSMAFQ